MVSKRAIPVLALLLAAGLFYYLGSRPPAEDDRADLYRIHVAVLGPDGSPAGGARVWSARGGDGRKVEGGWLIELPASLRPADGRFTVFASREDGSQGGVEVRLPDAPEEEPMRATLRLSAGR